MVNARRTATHCKLKTPEIRNQFSFAGAIQTRNHLIWFARLKPSSITERIPMESLQFSNGHTRKAFTLIELLVVISIISILAALLMPALMKAKAKSLSIQCMSNLKQLQTGQQMYSESSNEVLPENSVNVGMSGTNAWAAGNVQVYHDNYSADITGGTLYPYINSESVYRCPASKAFVHDFSRAAVPHNRSYSVSVWLNSNQVEGTRKSFTVKNPSGLLVFLDENPISIDNGAFGIRSPNKPISYWNLPSNRHDNGCNVSFIDGHVAHWKWTGPYLNSHNHSFSNPDSRAQRPDPDQNPTTHAKSDDKDPDYRMLQAAIPSSQ